MVNLAERRHAPPAPIAASVSVVAPAPVPDPVPAPAPDACPVLDIAVPVYDEERALVPNVRRLRAFVDDVLPWPTQVTIVDNGSTDATGRLADDLADDLAGVAVLHLAARGRGRALRAAWGASRADVVAYIDVDLSTSLSALLPLVAPLVSGHSDVAIGSRLAPGARVVRGPKREVISRGYNLLLRACLHNAFTDAQCGFKAVRADVARELLPRVEDQGWFFDTELLVLAERRALRIHEVPVDWVDDPDSRVHLLRTAAEDLRGVARLLTARRAAVLAGELVAAGVAAGGLRSVLLHAQTSRDIPTPSRSDRRRLP